MTSFWFVRLQLADRSFILPEGVFSAQLFNSYRTTRLTRGFGIQKAVKYEISQLFVVDLKGFEPSTSRMRTERSPKADILHPYLFKMFLKLQKSSKFAELFEQNCTVTLTHS